MLSEATACAPGNARVVLIEALLTRHKLLVSPASVTGTMQVLVPVHILSYSSYKICRRAQTMCLRSPALVNPAMDAGA